VTPHRTASEFLDPSDTLKVDAAFDSTIVLERDLILSDMAFELFVLTLREKPKNAAQMLFKGKASFVTLPVSPDALRYNEANVARLRAQMAAGKKIDFTSDLPPSWQDVILNHLDLHPTVKEATAVRALPDVEASPLPTNRLMLYLKAMRLHQWSKNILVFIPIIMAHEFFHPQPLLNTLAAFICFGLVASAIYLMNDMMDLYQDRRHPTKCKRPFASGALPVSHGLMLFPMLVGIALFIASRLPPMFALTMTVYFALNLSYTFYLKRKLLVDVLALSGAYTLRILAGNAAGPVELSNWLLAFSMFLFLSLALVKRYVELDTVDTDKGNPQRVMGRGYRKTDLDMLSQLGVASGFAAVIVLALFVDGAGKSGLYKHRELIWLVCPIVLYVIGRIWVLAKRRELPDDPIMFIIKDWRSHLMGVIVAFIFFMAI
jgi:4-hydroxybenzoate polyprenyltransferase